MFIMFGKAASANPDLSNWDLSGLVYGSLNSRSKKMLYNSGMSNLNCSKFLVRLNSFAPNNIISSMNSNRKTKS